MTINRDWLSVSCRLCKVDAGVWCNNIFTGKPLCDGTDLHLARRIDFENERARIAAAASKNPPASDEAGTPSEEPQPSPPVSSLRPVCRCGQTVWNDELYMCSDCMCHPDAQTPVLPLDDRIALAQAEPKRDEPKPWDWDARDAEYEL